MKEIYTYITYVNCNLQTAFVTIGGISWTIYFGRQNEENKTMVVVKYQVKNPIFKL